MTEAHTMEAKDMAWIIERLEAASGADRELDAEIGMIEAARKIGKSIDYARKVMANFDWPEYTRSIDSALSLVPEGWGWDVGDVHAPQEPYNEGGRPWAEIWLRGETDVALEGMSRTIGRRNLINAATPAIALCIAALRARSHKE